MCLRGGYLPFEDEGMALSTDYELLVRDIYQAIVDGSLIPSEE